MTGIFTAFAIAAITRGGVRRLAHQAAAGVVLRDLRHRAAHVDVDDVGAHAFDDLRGRRHLLGIAAEDLNRDRPLFLGVLGVLERPVDAAHQPFGAHHLGDDEAAAAVALDQAAERRVGHARHRRDGKRRREFDGADLHRVVSQYGFDVRRVDFDADRLADQIHRQHEPRLLRVLAHQPADDAAQRAVHDFDHHAFLNHRAGIVLQLAADQHAGCCRARIRESAPACPRTTRC